MGTGGSAGCAGRQAPPPPQEERRASAAYHEAFLAVEQARAAVAAAAEVRDLLERTARLGGSPEGCAALAEAGADLDAAWATLAQAYAAAAETLPEALDRGEHVRQLVRRREDVAVQRALDRRHHAAWAERCAAGSSAAPVEAGPPAASCGAFSLVGPVVQWRGPAPGALDLAGVLDLLGAVGAEVEADWDWVLVATAQPLSVQAAEAAVVAVDRGQPGRGRPPVDPAHVQAWPTLEGAVPLSGGPAALAASAFRGLLRGHLAGLPLAAGADCGPTPAGTWGASDVGGWLGGAVPGGLRMGADGRWRALWAAVPGPRLAGNPPTQVPPAPIELALLGLLPLEKVPQMTFLRRAEVLDADHLRAQGSCRLDGAGWAARFGVPPRRSAPLKVGLVLWGGDEALARRYAEALAAWARPPAAGGGPLSFGALTRGQGRLETPPARWHAACAGPQAALLSAP